MYDVIWEASDNANDACELSRTEDGWMFSVTEGRFSGYPDVRLNREQMVKLRNAIDNELNL